MAEQPVDEPSSENDLEVFDESEAFRRLTDYVERFTQAAPDELGELEAEFDQFAQNIKQVLKTARLREEANDP